ncbi:hypothetical protein J2Y41_002220 [Arthrobacter sp. 1088]|nr:hypothetical protein [Arthrobacter sp. 1088]
MPSLPGEARASFSSDGIPVLGILAKQWHADAHLG